MLVVLMNKTQKKQTQSQTIYKQFNESKNVFKVQFLRSGLILHIPWHHLHCCFLTQTQSAHLKHQHIPSIYEYSLSLNVPNVPLLLALHSSVTDGLSSEWAFFIFHCEGRSFLAPPLCSAVFKPDLWTEPEGQSSLFQLFAHANKKNSSESWYKPRRISQASHLHSFLS